jgi:hypothetical protein
LPDNMRPDRCGAIVVFDQTVLHMKVFVAAPVGAVIPEPTMNWLMRFAREKALPLLHWENLYRHGEYSGQVQSGFGPPAFRQAVSAAKGPLDVMSDPSSG